MCQMSPKHNDSNYTRKKSGVEESGWEEGKGSCEDSQQTSDFGGSR